MITLLLLLSNVAIAKNKQVSNFIAEVKNQHNLSKCNIDVITNDYFSENCKNLSKENVFKTYSSGEIKLYCIDKTKTSMLISNYQKLKNVKSSGTITRNHVCTDTTTTFYTLSFNK